MSNNEEPRETKNKGGRPAGSKNKPQDAFVTATKPPCPHCGSHSYKVRPGMKVQRDRYSLDGLSYMERHYMVCNECGRNFVRKTIFPHGGEPYIVGQKNTSTSSIEKK